jgi:tyrosine-protein kinase Etk/Wzc
MSDMVLVVIEAGRVPVKAAQRMRETLDTVRAPVVGFVMNDKDEKSYRRGGAYGYGYYKYGDYRQGYPSHSHGDKKKEREKQFLWWKR